MRRYQQFCKKQFEWELRNMSLGNITNITEEWLNEGNETWEHIYSVSTRNKSVDIIIFSSVDMRTNHVRDIGDDAVRVVMRWKTKRGDVFKRVGKNLRIKTLFKNLKHNIETAQTQIFDLDFKQFSKQVG